MFQTIRKNVSHKIDSSYHDRSNDELLIDYVAQLKAEIREKKYSGKKYSGPSRNLQFQIPVLNLIKNFCSKCFPNPKLNDQITKSLRKFSLFVRFLRIPVLPCFLVFSPISTPMEPIEKCFTLNRFLFSLRKYVIIL